MFNAILAAVLVSLISLAGALFLLNKKMIQAKYGGLMISVAAGVMLATALIDLLPEAMEEAGEMSGNSVYWAILAGVCGFFILERLLHWYHHHGHEHHGNEVKPAAYLVLIGDALHNFFDGLALATAFMVSVPVGVATTIAVILHEIPQELGDFVVLVKSGFSSAKALIYNLLSGITAVLGVLVGWYFLSSVEGSLSLMLAFNAGMFLYISCSDLIPSLHEDFKKDRKWLQTIAFLIGVVLMAMLISYLHV